MQRDFKVQIDEILYPFHKNNHRNMSSINTSLERDLVVSIDTEGFWGCKLTPTHSFKLTKIHENMNITLLYTKTNSS